MTLDLQSPTIIRQVHSIDQLLSVQHVRHTNRPYPYETMVRIFQRHEGINGKLKASGIIFCRKK